MDGRPGWGPPWWYGPVVPTLNATREGSLSGGSLLNSGPAWAPKQVPDQPGLLSKTLSHSAPPPSKEEQKGKNVDGIRHGSTCQQLQCSGGWDGRTVSSGPPGLWSAGDRVVHLKCSGFESSFAYTERTVREGSLILLSLCSSSHLM